MSLYKRVYPKWAKLATVQTVNNASNVEDDAMMED